jgi:hypothetical protein
MLSAIERGETSVEIFIINYYCERFLLRGGGR